MKKVIMLFNSHRYSLERVLAGANNGPLIEVPFEQLNLEMPIKYFEDDAMTAAADSLIDHGGVIFYKYEGRFVLLAGSATVKTNGPATLAGRLISGPALKRARIEDEAPAEVPQLGNVIPQGGFRRGEAAIVGSKTYGGRSQFGREDSRSSDYKSSLPNQRRQEPASGEWSRTRSPYRKPRDQS